MCYREKYSQPKFCDVRPEINCFNKETLFQCDCERWSSTSADTKSNNNDNYVAIAIGETKLNAAAHNTSSKHTNTHIQTYIHMALVFYFIFFCDFSAIFLSLHFLVAVAVVAWSKINYLYMLLTRARFVHTRREKIVQCNFRTDL